MGQGCLFKYLCLDFLPLGPYSNWPWISFWLPPSLPVIPSFWKSPVSSDKLARDQSCLQDVYLSTCFLEFIPSAVWPKAIIQAL